MAAAGGGKNDMERVGMFQEMGYVTINDKYKVPGSVQFNESAAKGKQLLPGGSKSKSALQAGYFADKFARIMESEAYSDPIKIRRQQRLKEGQRNIGKAFLPSNGEKKPSGLGSHYGTLGGAVSAFSPSMRAGKSYKSPGRNFTTNPGKIGTGFGYMAVTLGKYPQYMPSQYDINKQLMKKEIEIHKNATKGGAFKLNMHPKTFFDQNPYASDRPSGGRREGGSTKKLDVKPFKPSSPGKMPGGMKAGTFDPYPSHSADTYKVKVHRPINVVNKSGKTFTPSQGPKSVPTCSIINQNVVRSINSQNYREVRSLTVF
ncbi:hypothetical protein ScPMuIL_004322 [Solemya velum]